MRKILVSGRRLSAMSSESDKRCKKIIEILLDHPEGLKGDDIAKRLQVSSRTVRSDVKRLQELLEVHGIKISAITRGCW